MKINGSGTLYEDRTLLQPGGGNLNREKKAAAKSLFAKYLSAKPPVNNSSSVYVGYEHGSPFCQLLDDYQAWKEERKNGGLPDVGSSEDEKIAYLREHYSDVSDGLSLFDALSAMKEMGVISQVEYAYATGGPLIRISKEEMESGSFTVSHGAGDMNARWGGAFMTSPLASFHSLNDIFNWLENFRKEEHPASISQAEARLLGYI